MKSKTDGLQTAINATGFLSVVVAEPMKNGVSILCRHVPGKENQVLSLFSALLNWETAAKATFEGLSLLVSRRYLLKEGKMVFGWGISVQTKKATDFQMATISLVTLLSGIPVGPTQAVKKAPLAVKHRAPPSSTSIVLVGKRTDSDGMPIEEFEMPLPHQSKPMNVPTAPVWSEEHGKYLGGGRGARHTGESKR